MESDFIRIRGAREHNLQGVDLDIPKNRLTVFTGVSGSGKSSMAFDTLFAEGQRRYVESLSAYARQFLGQMLRPHYDAIRGLTPTIAVAQRVGGRNPRSTVGTLTEIHDHLRVLFGRAGIQHCHRCGRVVERMSAAEIVQRLMELPLGTRFLLLAPWAVPPSGGEAQPPVGPVEAIEEARKRGFARIRVDGRVMTLEEVPRFPHDAPCKLEVVVDRLERRDGMEDRLADSVETTLKAGNGILMASVPGEEDRIWSEKLSCLSCNLDFPELNPARFSFNNPTGMCPDCGGLGIRNEIDPRLVVPDPALTLHQGAIEPWKGPLTRKEGWNYQMITQLAGSVGFDLDTPWRDLPAKAHKVLLHGTGGERFQMDWEGDRGHGTFNVEWEGVLPALARRMAETKSDGMRDYYMAFMADTPCRSCGGSRLRPESRSVKVGPWSIVDLSRMMVTQARQELDSLPLTGSRATIARDLVHEIALRLRFLEDVGLGYLALDRPGDTLSGGEGQRIRLASQLGGELTGVTYVLDEPSIGLHPRDNQRLIHTLQRLRDLGNTVVVVEHDRETIEAADHVVDFGPGAGSQGGRVLFEGPPQDLRACGASLTGRYLSGELSIPVPRTRRPLGGKVLRVVDATEHNLQHVTVEFPLGCMVAVTGVSGAGKSSLVNGILAPALHNGLHHAKRVVGACDRVQGIGNLGKIIDIDQSPIGRSPRSNPATYTKVFDLIREIFAQTRDAKARGYGAARFSFNQKGGRCEACTGDGWRRIEMHFLADVYVPCEVCRGRRFNDATLQVHFKGRDIAQVLDMTVDEARDFFATHPAISRVLDTLAEVGLGYIQLGQPSDTLSGGEAQRVKLAKELARVATGDTLYLLDEPTTGLHFDDIRKLLSVLHRLVDAGNTVLVVEHNPEVIMACDHVIDLGPEGGGEGGRVVAIGTPEQVSRVEASHTGRVLRGC